MKYQVTFYSEKFKPVACIIEAENRTEIFGTSGKEAIKKICIKRGWTLKDFRGYGYKTFKCRLAE